MNDLQLALMGAGVLAVACVWIYNALQERKHRKLADAVFKNEHADVLLDAAAPKTTQATVTQGVPRREPGLATPLHEREAVETVPGQGLAGASAEAATASQKDNRNHTAPPETAKQEIQVRNGSAQTEVRGDDLLPWVDPLADCVVRFDLDVPVAASALWAAQSRSIGELSKPVFWLAREDENRAWTLINSESADRFSQWLVALQLVDRAGPIIDAELTRFYEGMQQLGHHLGVSSIDLPTRADVMLRAQELDQFCAGVDMQFSLSVVNALGAAFAGTKLRGVCEAAGLVLDRDGRYSYRNAAGEIEFVLGNLGNEPFDISALSTLSTHGVSLSIDVPRVTDGTAAFNRMVLVARQLAQGLGGTLVDAHRVALSEVVIATIRSKIGELQQILHRANIAPGGERALRLFS